MDNPFIKFVSKIAALKCFIMLEKTHNGAAAFIIWFSVLYRIWCKNSHQSDIDFFWKQKVKWSDTHIHELTNALSERYSVRYRLPYWTFTENIANRYSITMYPLINYSVVCATLCGCLILFWIDLNTNRKIHYP